jgi:hypothetical protein
MITTITFIKNILPAGKIPGRLIDYSDVSDLTVTIPFAVMGWDEGLDYNDDGTAYQDSPPCEDTDGAFETREEAEAHLAFRKKHDPNGRYWIEENHVVNLWEFNHIHWAGLDRPAYEALLLTKEELAQLESRLVREEVKTEYSEYTRVRLA